MLSHRERYENLPDNLRQMQINMTQIRTQERVRIERIQSRFIGRRREMPQRDYLGPMEKECQHCHARFWLCEKTGGSRVDPIFNRCCNQGDIVLSPLEVIPTLLQQLLDGEDQQAKEFRQNIRAYNSLLSFTSCGAKVDETLVSDTRGIFTYRIHGEMYHSMGSLLPSSNINQPKFLQMYFFDTENETDHRLNHMPNRDRQVIIRLQEDKTNKPMDSTLQERVRIGGFRSDSEFIIKNQSGGSGSKDIQSTNHIRCCSHNTW